MSEQLPAEILENDIHYTLVGDYYFPTCTLQEDTPVIGKWADLYEHYLQEKHPSEYTHLIWSCELNALLSSIQEQCQEKLNLLIWQMAKSEEVTEQLKAEDQLEWVRRMNNIKSRAEEMICSELLETK